MKKTGWIVALSLLAAVPVDAQVVITPATAKVEFTSPDHTALVPVGQANAGQALIASYQGMVFPLAADVATGTPLLVGPVVAKTLATTGTTAPYRLSLTQLGLTGIPACVVVAPATCPQYSILLVALGPGGTTARSVTSESDPFALASLLPPPLPAGPSGVTVLP